MNKADTTVLNETKSIFAWVFIFSILMEAIFLVVGRWSCSVLLGNLLSGSVAVLNFFLMGLTVQAAVNTDEKTARRKIQLSQSLRTLMLFVVAALGCALPFFNTAAVLIPFFFPRISILLRTMLQK